jgi:hypothetical protein
MFSKKVLNITFFLLLAATGLIHAQPNTQAILFRDPHSLTLFIPQNDGVVSLQGMTLQFPDPTNSNQRIIWNLATALLNVTENNCEAMQPLREHIRLAGVNANPEAVQNLDILDDDCQG